MQKYISSRLRLACFETFFNLRLFLAKSQLAEVSKQQAPSKGVAQERLALDAGVDRTVVSKIERAVTNPSIEILLKLANQLDVDLNDLFAN